MKKCSTCQELKALTEYNKHAGRKDGLQTVCRQCNRARARRYYAENGEKHRRVCTESVTQRRTVLKQKLCVYLTDHPCVDCGETDIIVLEFDHLRDKDNDVSRLISGGHSWDRVLKEIAKCDVVCCNCHRRRTSRRIGSYRTKYQAPLTQLVE